MKTTLHQVLETVEVPTDARIAFEEALTCYRADAARAALLFSYNGWALTLRRRLLQADCPPSITPGQWQAHQKALAKEEKWDTEVFDLTQMKNNGGVFLVTEDLRQQVMYWKNRRNDCAHFKNNAISHAHVESFWLFLQSNLEKFVPNGSSESLINQFRNHFDPDLTPPGAPIDDLVARTARAIEPSKLPDFLGDLQSTLGTRRRTSSAPFFFQVLDGLLGHPAAETPVAQFLLDHPDELFTFLHSYPRHVPMLRNAPQLVRNLWRVSLSAGREGLALYTSLVRSELIPEEELQEANSVLVEKQNLATPTDEDAPDLERCGYIPSFEAYLFTRGLHNYQWANSNARMIAWLVEKRQITDHCAKILCEVFGTTHHPFYVADLLGDMFKVNGAKREEFQNAARNLDIPIPKTLVASEEQQEE
jgi:hypothetical protein